MNKRRLKIGFASLIGAVTLGLTITAVSSNGGFAFSRTDGGLYSITLNSSNNVTSNGDHLMYTANGGEVTFTYTNTSSSTSGHVSLLDGGTVTNKDRITSIDTFSCSYSGLGYLTFKTSLDNSSWTTEAKVNSEQECAINSHPYYLALTAHGSVTILSARYTFTCVPNSSSSEYTKVTSNDDLTDGEYLIVYETGSVAFDGSLDTLDAAKNKIDVEIKSDAIIATDKIDASAFTIDMDAGTIQSASGYYIGNDDSGSNNLSSSTTTVYENTISIGERGEATIVSSGTYLRYNSESNQNRFRYYKSSSYAGQKAIHLYKKGGSSTPASEITKITVKSSTTTFNTKDKLEDYLNGITVDIEYDDSTKNVNNVAYADLSTYKLSLTLLNPSGISYETSTAFGTSGNWTIKVSDKADHIHGELSITVEAIPVSSITIGGTLTVEAGKTTQLTATVSPDYADNPSVTWESDDESVAIVSTTGLVTGVDVGTAKITATATDGSAKYGEVTIEVTEATVVDDEGVFELLQSGAPAIGDYVVFASDKSDGSAYAMSTQNSNNRSAVGVTITSSAIIKDENSTFAVFEVKAGSTSNTYSFYDINTEKYLYAASSNKNYLRSQNSVDANASWTISTTSGASIITAQGSNTRNMLRWNSNDSIFSAYTSGQAAPSMFVKQGQKVYPTQISITGDTNISTGSTATFAVSYDLPTGVNVKSTTWNSSDTTVATIETSGNSVTLTALKAGKTIITASAVGANNTKIEATKEITVADIAVTDVSLDKSSLNLEVGDTSTLIETITPSNATNKSVTWNSSDVSVATVSSVGGVKAIAAGDAVITVKTVDGDHTATCSVKVTASSSGGGSELGGSDTLTREITGVSGTSYSEWSGKTGKSGAVYAGQSAGSNNSIQLRSDKSNSGIVTTASGGYISSIIIAWNSNTASGRTVNVYGKNTAYSAATDLYDSSTQGTSLGTIICGTSTTLEITGQYAYIGVRSASNALYMDSITFVWESPEPVYPTAINFSNENMELGLGKSTTLVPNFVPSNTNMNKTLTWSSSDSSIISVSSTGKITANALGTASITASTKNESETTISASISVTVVETANDKWTIMIYLCGSDLESGDPDDSGNYHPGSSSYGGGYATKDIAEILSVSGQPDDVNIIIETGGSAKWASTYGINENKLQRWHVSNKHLQLDETLDQANMAESSTFQSFLEWGLTEYPADKTGVILWNHGGAMRGVCYDDNYATSTSSDSLTSPEVKTAVKNAFDTVGRTEKLEWIGYDACLMAVQDIAEFNSEYFNYMVASEESEAGYGWDYDTWVDDLYNYKSTETILTAIVDGFISDTNSLYSTNNWGASDQTLAYLDLSYMSTYKTAFESFASNAYSVINSYGDTNFRTLMKTVKSYGDTIYDPSDYSYYGYSSQSSFVSYLTGSSVGAELVNGYYYDYGYYYYGIFDIIDFFNKLSVNSSFSSLSSYITAAKNAANNLIAHSNKGSGAGNSNGLCLFFPLKNSKVTFSCNKSTYYSTSMTNFTSWKAIVDKFGQ